MELEAISEDNQIQTNIAFFLSYAESRFKTYTCTYACTMKAKEELKGGKGPRE